MRVAFDAVKHVSNNGIEPINNAEKLADVRGVLKEKKRAVHDDIE